MDFNGLPIDPHFMGASCTEYAQTLQTDDSHRSMASLLAEPSITDASVTAGPSRFDAQSGRHESQPTVAQTSKDSRAYSINGQEVIAMPNTLNSNFDLGALDMTETSSFFPLTRKDISPSVTSAIDAAATDGSSYRDGDVATDLLSPEVLNSLGSARTQGLFKGTETRPESGGSCMLSALGILKRLHVPATACLCSFDQVSMSSASRQPRNTDFVLSTNRHIVQRVAELLKCSCAFSGQVQLLLAVICGKLIAWYRAVIHNFPDREPGANTTSSRSVFTNSSSSSATGDGTHERVIHQPFAVGNHLFDTGLERKIRAQVVFSELQQLETVVAELSARIWEESIIGTNPRNVEGARRRSQSTSAVDPTTVHSHLTTFLHKQLQDAKAETIIISKDG